MLTNKRAHSRASFRWRLRSSVSRCCSAPGRCSSAAPLNIWDIPPELYYRSVTAHGSVMGYVFPTLVAMGFGYAITELALEKPLIGLRWAWAGFILVAIGAVTAMIPVSWGSPRCFTPSIRR